MRALAVSFPLPVPYAAARHLQDRLVAARQAGRIADTILLLEHPPVITLGIRARQEHLLLPAAELARRGISVVDSPRGGDITYHAPGQLVLYPILKLTGTEADVHAFVGALEEIAIRVADRFGIAAFRRKGKTGAWTDRGKLAAIGVRFRRWISSHGMSFNVNLDLSGFDTIVPCGLHGEPVTSLHALLGDACPPMEAVRTETLRQFRTVLRRTPDPLSPEDLLERLGPDAGKDDHGARDGKHG